MNTQTLRNLLEIFKTPSAPQLAQRELEEAERLLLEAHSQREYCESMVNYYQKKITRLQNYL
jgi:hypothetical protein